MRRRRSSAGSGKGCRLVPCKPQHPRQNGGHVQGFSGATVVRVRRDTPRGLRHFLRCPDVQPEDRGPDGGPGVVKERKGLSLEGDADPRDLRGHPPGRRHRRVPRGRGFPPLAGILLGPAIPRVLHRQRPRGARHARPLEVPDAGLCRLRPAVQPENVHWLSGDHSTVNPSLSAAAFSRWSLLTKGSDAASSRQATRAAANCSASAARSGMSPEEPKGPFSHFLRRADLDTLLEEKVHLLERTGEHRFVDNPFAAQAEERRGALHRVAHQATACPPSSTRARSSAGVLLGAKRRNDCRGVPIPHHGDSSRSSSTARTASTPGRQARHRKKAFTSSLPLGAVTIPSRTSSLMRSSSGMSSRFTGSSRATGRSRSKISTVSPRCTSLRYALSLLFT